MQDDIDLKVWQQERDFWIPRVSIILTSNSLLFLGYVMIIQNILGIFICALAFLSNVAMLCYLHKYEEKIDSLEQRINRKLPFEYRDFKKSQRPPNQGIRSHLNKLAGYGFKGRGGYRMVIIVFLILWAAALSYSIWVNYQIYTDSRTIEEDAWKWNPSKEICINFAIPNQSRDFFLNTIETKNFTIKNGSRYEFYALQLNSSNNWSKSAMITIIENS